MFPGFVMKRKAYRSSSKTQANRNDLPRAGRRVGFCLLAAFSVWLVACSGPEPQREEIERAKQIERGRMSERIHWVDLRSLLKLSAPRSGASSSDVLVYLQSLAARLASRDPVLRSKPVSVALIEEVRGQWRSFGLPGHQLYLSRAVVRSLEFENEAAALLAFELAHVARFSLVERLEAMSGDSSLDRVLTHPTENELFGDAGLLTFDDKAHSEAAARAVGYLYECGYDARGMTRLFLNYRKNPAQNPYGESTIEKLEDVARRSVAYQSPLRNPIVRSAEFLRILPRLKTL